MIVCWTLACAQRPLTYRHIGSIDEVTPLENYQAIEVDTFDKRLNLLLSVQSEIPTILKDAARYDVNLFEILEHQNDIQKHLLADDEYRSLMDQFHSKQIEIKILPKKNQKVYTYKIDSAQLNRFRWDLKEALDKYKNINGVKKELFHKVNALGMRSSRGLETGLIKSLPKELQKNAFEIKDKKLLSDYLAKHLPDRISSEFKASDYNLLKNPKKGEVLKKLHSLRALEDQVTILMSLMLMRTEAIGDLNSDLLRIQSGQLANFSNKESLSIKLDYLKNKELKTLAPKVNDNVYQLVLNFFRSYSSKMQIEEEWADEGITLKQISPTLAIFRGYVGCDCATKRSFAYVNIPSEMVFFIYDKNHKTKGYVEGHIVENAKGERIFKIISFNGPRISAQDVLLTLEALNLNKEELKVAYIALPALDRIDSLINYDVIKATFKESIAKSKLEEITYLDGKYRTYLSELGGKYNESVYDAMELNTNAVRYHSEEIGMTTQKRWYSTQYNLNRIKSKQHLDFLFRSNVAFKALENNIDDASYVKYEYDDIIKETEFDELFNKFKYYLALEDKDLFLAVRNYFAYFSKTTDFDEKMNKMPLAFFHTLSDVQLKQTFNLIKKPSKRLMRMLIVEGDADLRRTSLSYLGSRTDFYLDEILDEVILKLSADDFNVMFSTMKNKISDKFYQKNMSLFFEKGDSGTHRHLINKLGVIEDKALIKKLLKTMDSSYVNSIIYNNLSLSVKKLDNEIFEILLAKKDSGINQKIIEQIFSQEWSKPYEKYFRIIINDSHNMIALSLLTRSPLFMEQKDIELIILNKIKAAREKDKNGELTKNTIRNVITEKSTGNNLKLQKMIFDEFELKAFEIFLSTSMLEREGEYNQELGKYMLSKIKRAKEKHSYYQLIEKKIFNTYSTISFSFLKDYVASLYQNEQVAFLERLVSTKNSFKPEQQILLLHELVKNNRASLLRNRPLSDRINAYVNKHQENKSLEALNIIKLLSLPLEIKKIELNCVDMIRLFYK